MNTNVSTVKENAPVYTAEQMKRADQTVNIAIGLVALSLIAILSAYGLHQAHVIGMKPVDMVLTIGIRALAVGLTIAYLGSPRGYGFGPVNEEGPEDLKELSEEEKALKYDQTLRYARLALIAGTIMSLACSLAVGSTTIFGDPLSQEVILGLNAGAVATFGAGFLVANLLERRVPHTHKTKKERDEDTSYFSLNPQMPASYYQKKYPDIEL